MSGRSNFRKSHHPLLGRYGTRRGPRTAPSDMPDWRATFMVPGAATLKVGVNIPTNVIGVTIRPGPLVVVTGKQREWVLGQAAKFFGLIANGHRDMHVTMNLTRSSENAPTKEAPARLTATGYYDLIYTAGPAVILQRPHDSPIIYPM